MTEWIRLLRNDELPDKVAYDIRRLAEAYRAWPDRDDDEKQLRRRALKSDLERLLTRKSLTASTVVSPFLLRIASPTEAIDLANRVIIAGVIQKAQQQANGGPV